MKLLVGLGNPDDKYADTYHNVGFMALDALAERLGCAFSTKKNALFCDTSISGDKIILIKPLTYMNLSGDAVEYFSRYYKIAPRDILVIYDDIDLNKGTVRARQNGSAGTHNGMRDIIAKIGSSDFARVRIGTGPKPSYMDLADYVLSHIPQSEKQTILAAANIACDYATDFASGKAWQDLSKNVAPVA